MSSPKALIVGSVAYDVIFSIHGNIKNEILDDTDGDTKINLMFTASNQKRYFGGTGGNISYGLGLLGASPLLFSVVGNDFTHDYQIHLQSHNIETRVAIRDGHTATFYGISDEELQQIGIWQPDVYGDTIEKIALTNELSATDWEQVVVAIFSPGTGISTTNHMLEVRERRGKDVQIIFDPSQVLSIFYDTTRIEKCLRHSDIVISNETEIFQFEKLFGYSTKDILDAGPHTVIETLGEDGCRVHTATDTLEIPAVKPSRVVETTGAGDAFRSGLIFGLLQNMSIPESCIIGTQMGAKSVEEFGGQQYTLED